MNVDNSFTKLRAWCQWVLGQARGIPKGDTGEVYHPALYQADPIDSQLHDLSRQGASMARVAHSCATMLVILFSAGSLVALGADALRKVMSDWTAYRTLDIPSIISLAVSFLMVIAMDVAMLAAASMLRLLISRRATWSELGIHIAVMAVVAALESGTYLFMSWTYEHPESFAAGALIGARALAAPLLAVYLSMSRVLPVTSRDILGMVELASAAGVLRDVTQVARDQTAPLAAKMELYGASAIMPPADRHRLDTMISVVNRRTANSTDTNTQAMLLAPSESPYTRVYSEPSSPGNLTSINTRVPLLDSPESALSEPGKGPERPDPTHPTGPGSPTAVPMPSDPGVRTPVVPIPLRREPNPGQRKVAARSRSKQNAEARVRAAWHSGMSVSQIERAARVSRSTAHKWNRVLIGEYSSQAQTGEVAQ